MGKFTGKICFLLFFLTSSIAISQNQKIADSLLCVLSESGLSKKERANTLRSIAVFHPDLNNALLSAKRALEISIEIKDSKLQAEALEEISGLELRLGNNTLSFRASLQVLQIYKSLNMLESQAAAYAQLANNYLNDKNYDLAIDCLKKANHIYATSNKNKNHAMAILNLGEVYRLAGHLDSAVTCFKKSLALNKTLNDDIIQGYSQGNLGMVYVSQNKLAIAKENLNKAIAILSPIEDYYSICIYTAEVGEVNKKEGNIKAAEDKFLQALMMAKQNGLKEQIRDFSAELSLLYERELKYSEALKYQRLYQIYQDSLVNKETIKKLEQLKTGYEIDKRESEISLLNTINTNQKYWVIVLAVIVSVLVFFAYLLYIGNKKIKAANNTLSNQKEIITKREQEKALLLRELNHRIKNNLQMISSLLNLQSHELIGHPAREAIIAGKNRVEALSLVHRKLYEEDLDARLRLKDYIEELVLGLFHSYDAKFKPSFKIDDLSVSLDVAVPLALVINEIIINSLKYAYKGIKNPILKVIITSEKDFLNIVIMDNGIGFNDSVATKNNSFGIKLIHSLIAQLEGFIQKLDRKNGTHWKIRIKFI
ncbi:MAG: tetratricopeptide repeat protein [Aequorivita antarctica]